ncbi:MAG TPA: hypothetical protein ENM97_00140 [Moorella mulderi]|nr:hypothetical protein [Moorella mulderi]
MAASGVLYQEGKKGKDTVLTFVGAGMRDFALAMSPHFKTLKAQVGESELWVYTTDRSQKHAQELLRYGQNALDTYSRLFGPIPYKRISIVAAPLGGGAGGTEFSGLVLIGEGILGISGGDNPFSSPAGKEKRDSADLFSVLGSLLGGGSPSGQDKKGSTNPFSFLLEALGLCDFDLGSFQLIMEALPEMVVVHELGHQWWYSLVGARSLEAPWLDESLTQYSGFVALEHSRGVVYRNAFLKNSKMTVNMACSLGGCRGKGITLPVEEYGNELCYAALVYEKGALFYHALREAVGDEAFFGGLRDYAQKYRYRMMPDRGPIECIKARSKDPRQVDLLVQEWLQQKCGLPGEKDRAPEGSPRQANPLGELLGRLLEGLLGDLLK